MHLERIYQEYHEKGVRVALALINASDYTREREFPRFSEEFGVSYTGLDDELDRLPDLYKLNPGRSVPKVIIIDREGVVQLVGEATPWTEMASKLESILGELEDPDLSTPEKAIASLEAPSSYVRWQAAQELGEMGGEAAVEPLMKALSDESAVTREMAVQALGKIGDRRALEPLIAALEDEGHIVRLEAVKALGQMPDKQAIVPLVKLLGDAKLQTDIADALGEMNQPELVNKALEENSAILRSAGEQGAADVYYRLGLAYKGREMYDAAIPVLEQAVELASGNFARTDYVNALAECYMDSGEGEKAAEAYLKALRDTPGDRISVMVSFDDGVVERYTLRGWTVWNLVQSAQSTNRLEPLAEILEAKLSESPQDLVIYAFLTRIYDGLGVPEKSIQAYERKLKLGSGGVKDYALLAQAYSKAGMSEKAAAAARKMGEAPGEQPPYSLMAKTFIQCKMYDEATQLYEDAIAVTRNDWEKRGYQLGLAGCYELTEEYAKAAAEYENIIETYPGSYHASTAETQVWEVYKKGGLYGMAIEKYQKMVEADPEDVEARVFLAKAYREKGEPDKAIAEYEAATKIKPDDFRPFEALGDLCNEQGDLEKAMGYYKEASKLAPDDPVLHDRLGDLYRSHGMMAEAIAEYEKTQAETLSMIEQGSIDPSVYDRLARFYIRKEVKSAEAVSLAQKAVELAPDDLGFVVTLGMAYLGNGQEEKAQQQWAKTGFIRDTSWMVVGPFDNTNGAGFSEAYPPEQSIDVHATYKGKDKEVAWTEAKDNFADAYIDLNEIFEKADWVVAYAYAQVISPEEREAQLRVGSDDDVRIWLNGEEVLSQNIARSVAIDQDIVPVKLRDGMNEILVKVCERAVDWGFYLRITDMEGKPYDDLSHTSAAKFYSSAR